MTWKRIWCIAFYLTKILMLEVKLITLNRTIKSTFHVKDGNNKMFIIIQFIYLWSSMTWKKSSILSDLWTNLLCNCLNIYVFVFCKPTIWIFHSNNSSHPTHLRAIFIHKTSEGSKFYIQKSGAVSYFYLDGEGELTTFAQNGGRGAIFYFQTLTS